MLVNYFESNLFQVEEIFLDRHSVGKIEIFYDASLGSTSKGPFIIEDRNLLKGIANVISFNLKKHKDDDNCSFYMPMVWLQKIPLQALFI